MALKQICWGFSTSSWSKYHKEWVSASSNGSATEGWGAGVLCVPGWRRSAGMMLLNEHAYGPMCGPVPMCFAWWWLFFYFFILEIWTLPPRLHQLHQPGVKKSGYRGKTTSLALPHVHCDPARISVSASHLLVTLLDVFLQLWWGRHQQSALGAAAVAACCDLGAAGPSP